MLLVSAFIAAAQIAIASPDAADDPVGDNPVHEIFRYPERSFPTIHIELRKDSGSTKGWKILGAESLPRKCLKSLDAIARKLDSFWRADFCGAMEDTFELQVICVANRSKHIDGVSVTAIEMYDKGSAVPDLMRLGAAFSKSLGKDHSVRIFHTGRLRCDGSQ